MKAEDAQALANIIGAIDSDQLGQNIDAMLQRSLTFDMSCGYLFRFNHNALMLHNGYKQSVPDSTLNAYLRGGYLLDPFYVACIHDHPAGLWRMRDLAPDSFFSSGFSISKDIHPCVSSEHGTLVEEVGFIIPIRPQVAVVYSLMRNLSSGTFADAEMKVLEALAPMLASAFELHCRIRHGDCLNEDSAADVRLEDAFIEILQGQLTSTQRYIAKLILQGHSNASIAARLKISEGTLKVHKHNIYLRLDISSNAELFRLFINYLARQS